MDAMTNTAAAPAPAPTPAPPPAPAPMPMTAAPMSTGGDGPSKQGVMEIMKGLNWTEILFGVLGTATLYYTIYYFRHNMSMSKSFQTDVENKVDELTMRVSDLSSVINAQSENKPSNDLFGI